MELVIVLLLANLLGLGYMLFWARNFSKTSAQTHYWYKNALQTNVSALEDVLTKLNLTKRELRKVHMLCHETCSYSFDTQWGMPYLHEAVDSRFDEEEHDKSMQSHRSDYVDANFTDDDL